jgi:ABC-type nitrate/sulfonate/bicarbonate transport system substrate-binding protein
VKTVLGRYLILLAVTVVGLFVAQSAIAQLTRPTKIRIGLAGRNFSFLPFFAAADLKFFEQEGISRNDLYEIAGSDST